MTTVIPQHEEALGYANEVRRRVAEFKDGLREAGKVNGALRAANFLIDHEARTGILGACKVGGLLLAIPGIGEVRSGTIRKAVGVSDTRRVRDLTERQAQVMAELLRSLPHVERELHGEW